MNTAAYYNVPPGVKPPDWMLSPEYDGLGWRVYNGFGMIVKQGPQRNKAGVWVCSGWDE